MVEKQLKLRASNTKEDCQNAAEALASRTNIEPWSTETLRDLIRASYRTHGLPTKPKGNTKAVDLDDLESWFTNRIQYSTVSLGFGAYKQSLASSLYDVVVAELDPTDLDGFRQRSLVQHLDNALSGYLAELAVARFFESKGIDNVYLDFGRSADVQDMIGSDIDAIEIDGERRDPAKKIQIKMSKPGSLWLPIGSKDEATADVYVLARVGLPYMHFVQYLDRLDVLQQSLSDLDGEKIEQITSKLPDFNPIPVHISGYATWPDFKRGSLEVVEKQKRAVVSSGVGSLADIDPNGYALDVEGLSSPSEDYLGAVSSLKWTAEEWEDLIKSL